MTAPSAANPAVDFLLIGGGFFGYAKEIAATLERRGRHVRWFEDRPAVDNLTKALVRLAPALVAAKAEAYFDAIIEEVRAQPIRDVLVIKGESLSPAAIGRLRQALPRARFTLYFWDSYRNMPSGSAEKVVYFDKAYTFDSADASRDARLTYRPLWFLDEYQGLPLVDQDIDVLFFGTVHTDRYAVVKRLSRVLPPELKFEKVMYFPSRLIYRARRAFDPDFWGARDGEFIFKPLDKKAILSLIARSRIVVDIERSVQSGLTMRTIEMLGAGRKLVTTNPASRDADFFDAHNIAVIDRAKPLVTEEFLSQSYRPPPDEILRRYSLAGWIDEVLGA